MTTVDVKAGRMAGERILVVDDNLLNLKLATVLLVRAGYRVDGAASANEAIAQLEREPPQLIILDLRLPEIGGLELARTWKQDPRFCGIPIIAMTASGLRADEEDARLAGCEHYMAKPFVLAELLEQVARCLNGTCDVCARARTRRATTTA